MTIKSTTPILTPTDIQVEVKLSIPVFIIKYGSTYVIVGIDKEKYGFPKTYDRKTNLVIIIVWKAIGTTWSSPKIYLKKASYNF